MPIADHAGTNWVAPHRGDRTLLGATSAGLLGIRGEGRAEAVRDESVSRSGRVVSALKNGAKGQPGVSRMAINSTSALKPAFGLLGWEPVKAGLCELREIGRGAAFVRLREGRSRGHRVRADRAASKEVSERQRRELIPEPGLSEAETLAPKSWVRTRDTCQSPSIQLELGSGVQLSCFRAKLLCGH